MDRFASFTDRHGLRTADDRRHEADVLERVRAQRLEVVRLAIVDQHGVLRGKTITAAELAGAFRSGVSLTTTLLLKDTSHRTVFPVWARGGGLGDARWQGAGDVLMVPVADTFRVLPWSPHSGWMLCDMVMPDGTPVPFSTRAIAQRAAQRLAHAGYDFVCGLEVECTILRLTDPRLSHGDVGHPGAPPDTGLLSQGYRYLTELAYDELEPVMDLVRRTAEALGLPLRSMEVEFGPSQVEFTFRPARGIAHGDAMVLFRSAVKQVCRRAGWHATFMCRPGLEGLFANGWHLHQSLVDRESGANAFMEALPEDGGPVDSKDGLSPVCLSWIAGLLEHAAASCLFTTPTINGYKRYRPNVLAPDRIQWGRDNRGAMVRAIGAPGEPDSRIENRVGEPAANPYLYLASQMLAGLDGVERRLRPPPPCELPYDNDAQRLPTHILDALTALDRSAFFRTALGDLFVDYLLTIKRAEVARFLGEVTEWEQREYFSLF